MTQKLVFDYFLYTLFDHSKRLNGGRHGLRQNLFQLKLNDLEKKQFDTVIPQSLHQTLKKFRARFFFASKRTMNDYAGVEKKRIS